MLRHISLLALLALAFGATADETDLGGVTGLKVDLDRVVELGTVSPVDGVTSAGQPDKAALEVFADVGYATIIDLRGANENRGFEEAITCHMITQAYLEGRMVKWDPIERKIV